MRSRSGWVAVVMMLTTATPTFAFDGLRAEPKDVSWKVHRVHRDQFLFCGPEGDTCDQIQRRAMEEAIDGDYLPEVRAQLEAVQPDCDGVAEAGGILDGVFEEIWRIKTGDPYEPGIVSSRVWKIKPNGNEYSDPQRGIQEAHRCVLNTTVRALSPEMETFLSVAWTGESYVNDPLAWYPPITEPDYRYGDSHGLIDARVELPEWTPIQRTKIIAVKNAHRDASMQNCAAGHNHAGLQEALKAIENDPDLNPTQRTLVMEQRFTARIDPAYSDTDRCLWEQITDREFQAAWDCVLARDLICWRLHSNAHQVYHVMRSKKGLQARAKHLVVDNVGRIQKPNTWPFLNAEQVLAQYRAASGPESTPTPEPTPPPPPADGDLVAMRFYVAFTIGGSLPVPRRSTDPPLVVVLSVAEQALFPLGSQRVPSGDTANYFARVVTAYVVDHPLDYPDHPAVVAIRGATRVQP